MTDLHELPALAGGPPVRSSDRAIVFGAPLIGPAEIASVADCLRSRWIGQGPRVEQFEQQFAAYKQAPYAAAVSSGTAALHLALVALGIGAGDEVIAPAMTFFSAIHAVLHAGATPVLADCDPRTSNLIAPEIERRITARTKAVMVVHMRGRCCDMEPILDLARRRNLRVIEDCAHAIESTCQGQPAGLLGDIGCFSFYATKNITTGDGGMAIMRDRRLFRRYKVLSSHGMLGGAWDRVARCRSGYRAAALGFKFNMTDMEAALGLVQLAELEPRWQCRQRAWHAYNGLLQDFPCTLPPPPDPGARHAYHLYSPLLHLDVLPCRRQTLMRALRAENIGSGVHYVPVHQHPYYRRRFSFRAADFPNAAFVGDRTISLPLTAAMSDEDVADVCAALRRIVRYYSLRSSAGQ